MARRRKKLPILEQINILDVAAEGKCVAKTTDGQVIFVKGVVPGDVVDLQITRKKKSFLEAKAIHFHTYSDERTEPFCSHFGVCGGCKWQHLPYSKQLFYKEKQVIDQFERIGKVDLPEIQKIIGAEPTEYYRNKLEFTFSNHRWLLPEEVKTEGVLDRNALGFHVAGRFDRIVQIDHCYLQEDPSNAIRLAVKDLAIQNNFPFYDVIKHEGWLRNLIIRTSNIGELMVILQVHHQEDDALNNLLEMLKAKFPQITSLQYIINPKKNETFHDLQVVTYHGKPYITEQMEDLKFRIGAKSFFQTNSSQALKLYQITREMAQLTGNEVVYDLYTGTGTIANFVAHQAKEVIGIEYVEMAVADARINSEINGIENTRFYAGDMKDILKPDFLEKHPKPEVIITDPPRAGMHADVVQVLLQSGAKRIVYVSCNPATQARDVQMLSEKYYVTAIQPVDMFPHTHHVENVACLELF